MISAIGHISTKLAYCKDTRQSTATGPLLIQLRPLARVFCPALCVYDRGGSSLAPAASWWVVTPAERKPVSNTVLTEAGSNPISLAFGGCASLPFNRSAKCNCSQRC